MQEKTKKTDTCQNKTGKNNIRKNKNTNLLILLSSCAGFMIIAAFLSVPLYDTFCRVTGFAGKPKKSDQISNKTFDQEVLVRFDANHSKKLPWIFKPLQNTVKVKIGEEKLIYYTVTNTSDQTIYGTATYNVTPYKVAPYFIKLECFCFQEQKLAPKESMNMPVLFYIDSSYQTDDRVKKINEITLSYTFFPIEK